jgi:hypothetical protein
MVLSELPRHSSNRFSNRIKVLATNTKQNISMDDNDVLYMDVLFESQINRSALNVWAVLVCTLFEIQSSSCEKGHCIIPTYKAPKHY